MFKMLTFTLSECRRKVDKQPCFLYRLTSDERESNDLDEILARNFDNLQGLSGKLLLQTLQELVSIRGSQGPRDPSVAALGQIS